MAIRFSVPDFQFANPMYVGAQVSLWVADANGNKTATLATLYDAFTGVGTLTNPQVLDADGKFASPVYCEVAVVAEVVNSNGVADHETGVIGRQELTGSATYDPPSVSAGAINQTTVTVTGAAIGDLAIASFSSPHANMLVSAQVTSANTVTVTFQNTSGGAIDLSSGTVRVRVFKA